MPAVVPPSPGSNNVRPKAEKNGTKLGSCYRCMKGNRFTQKETCIVCSARYCSNCVVRAMGSMPEGRKCVACVGFRIDEARRESLGKCSKMLERLLTETEIKQIMRSEMSCRVNQLPPELVFVNGDPLSQKQMDILQGCPNPPKKLAPGQYWYDKTSGFWGKVGHKPCQIISPELEVGGRLAQKASNGKTDVFINHREITKREVWMLKAAGVQCRRHSCFWLSADGSYQEMGSNLYVIGHLWDKKRLKLVCTLLSLPNPKRTPCGDTKSGTMNHV